MSIHRRLRDIAPATVVALCVGLLGACSTATPPAGASVADVPAAAPEAPAAVTAPAPATATAPAQAMPRAASTPKPTNASRAPAAAPATAAPPPATEPVTAAAPAAAPVCSNCGAITDIREITTEGHGSGAGIVAGGLAGIIVGNQIGGGNGKTLAKITGAAAGAFLGNKVEKKVRATTTYEVSVKLDSGEATVVTLDHKPGPGIGAAVRIAGGDVIER